jgi:Zn-dependent M16 (insulinase) family peptidase
MSRSLTRTVFIALTVVFTACTAFGQNYFEQLEQGEKVNGFTTTAVYENGRGAAMGARFVADKYGFVIDLLQIQSVPQGFFWVNTPPKWDKGEPHTCEHLLLGKGNVGRYVSGLEDMSLGSSSAWTSQMYTVYHFNTKGGADVFYDLFEAKLNAFLNPDFTDEEIRREVCHIGVTINPDDSSLQLDEKGTVYTEMVSSFEKHWYHLWGPMDNMIYGSEHPLANNSGGIPDAIRTMTPDDLWTFHKEFYRLGNMGIIIAIPDEIAPDDFLAKTSGIMARVQSFEESPEKVGMRAYHVPPPAPEGQPGEILIGGFPSENPQDPGHLLFGYPAQLDLSINDEFMLDVFLSTLASGQTSNLYRLLINSETKVIDIGGTSAWGYYNDDLGYPVYFGMSSVTSSEISGENVARVRDIIIEEMSRIAAFADGSEELAEFNERALAYLASSRKQLDEMFNGPPMFGFRSGAAGRWYGVLSNIERAPEFRKSLVQKNQFEHAEQLLNGDKNIWADYVAAWKLTESVPIAVAIKPDAEMIRTEAQAKEERLAAYTTQFKQKYDVDNDQEAIARYKEEFDATTAEVEALYASGDMPRFMDNPPMTLDPQLKYDVYEVVGSVPMVASTFDNMTSSTVGLAMGLDVVPEDKLLYLPFLSSAMTDVGVIKDGETIKYDDMENRIRKEILALHAYTDYNPLTGRVEMVLRGRGANRAELETALGWMDAALFDPYLSEDNLPRLRDVVDQSLIGARNRMKGSEENWVQEPASGWRYQHNPLLLTANNFLTQAHHLHRLKFRLMDPGTEQDQALVAEFAGYLRSFAGDQSTDDLMAALSAIEDTTQTPDGKAAELKAELDKLAASETAYDNALAMVRAIKVTLPELPQGSLVADWEYLCRQMEADLNVPPAQTLEELKGVLALLRHKDNTRMFMVSSSVDREATSEKVEALMAKFDDAESQAAAYTLAPRVLDRLHDHTPDAGQPTYVGLINENTRNGVLIMTATNASPYAATESPVLDCLAGKLYSGGGGHSLFMKTWGAGLAYSNGVAYSERSGMVRYYAERCPDVSETMRFVVNELKNAKDDPSLGEYAIAQVFGISRAANRYEQRGESMASDLADGYYPELVSQFRQRVLSVRGREDLYSTISKRMENVYGKVMVGYGDALSKADGHYFIIGPEPQFESMEKLISAEEEAQPVNRLYPRDFWLTM